MRVRIGITDTSREFEVESDDLDAFIKMLDKAFASEDRLIWLTDVKGHRVGIPTEKIAYVEAEDDQRISVGFS